MPPAAPPRSALPPTIAMVLCAGLGTRLRPLTEELPKPLVPIGDRSLLHHVVACLGRQGVERIVINTHHAAEAFAPAQLATLALPTSLVHEPAILGTAGGVRNARSLLGDDEVLVWNGDILAEVELARLAAAHRASRPLATLAVAPARDGAGNVGVDDRGRVVRLRAERFGDEVLGCDFVGVQLLSGELRRALPEQGCLVGDALLPALREGGVVRAATAVARWSDVGTVAAYLEANLDWLRAAGLDGWVGPDAQVGREVSLCRSVVGAGATVKGRGELRDCVLWPGACAEAPLARTVVTSAGRSARADAA